MAHQRLHAARLSNSAQVFSTANRRQGLRAAKFWLPAVWLLAALLVGGCSDDTSSDGGGPSCLQGMRLNPVTGQCERNGSGSPQADTGLDGSSNPGPGTSDAGDQHDAQPTDPDAGPGEEPPTPQPDTYDCEGNERRCVGNKVEACQDGQFVEDEVCDNGLQCERGRCIRPEGTCQPGIPRCVNQNSYQFCSQDGESYDEPIDCPDGARCVNGRCSTGCDGMLDEKSNLGCQYVTMRLNQASGIQTLPHSVVVSNPGDRPATVRVTSDGINGLNIPETIIQSQESAIIDFPTNNMVSAPGVSDKLYILNTNQPVIATQFAPLNNPGIGSETSDASLLLPTNALGREYVVLNWPGPGGLGGSFPGLPDIPGFPGGMTDPGTYLDVVAIEDNTTVQISSPRALTAGNAGTVAANSSQSFNIGRYKILHLGINSASDTDISGTTVSADKPVAVFVGATIVNIPSAPIRENPPAGCVQEKGACTLNDDCCSGVCGVNTDAGGSLGCLNAVPAGDHLEQQLFPVDTWGTSYIATPFYKRSVNDFSVFKVTAANNNTQVTLDPPINGVSDFTLNRGQVREFYSQEAFEIKGSDVIMAAQFMVGGSISSSGDGDPAFLLPPAVQQFRDNYVFLVPGRYAMNFVTLIAPVGTDVELDGTTHAASSFTALGGSSNWSYKLIDSMDGGVHTASADANFGVVVHGMDNYISYAFAGGIILPD